VRFPRLRKKGRAYYYDTQAKPRKWIPLGSDESAALAEYRKLVNREASSGTIGKMLAEYVDWLTGQRSKNTILQYRVWEGHLAGIFGHMRPAELTQADVARYLDECPRKNARGEISVLSGAYHKWLRAGLVTFNPCIGSKSLKKRPARTRLLSTKELLAVLEHSSPLLAVAIELAYATGLRVSDLVAARWDQFTDDAPIQTAKRGARLRFRLDDDLRGLLARCRALQGRVVSLHVLGGRGGRPIHRQTLTGWWRAACKSAGVQDAVWHDIRAAAISEKKRRAGEKAAQEFAGHTTLQATRVYLRGRDVTEVEALKLARNGL
jgi:integrase